MTCSAKAIKMAKVGREDLYSVNQTMPTSHQPWKEGWKEAKAKNPGHHECLTHSGAVGPRLSGLQQSWSPQSCSDLHLRLQQQHLRWDCQCEPQLLSFQTSSLLMCPEGSRRWSKNLGSYLPHVRTRGSPWSRPGLRTI